MEKNILKNIESDKEIVAHYDLLKRIGLWNYIENMEYQIKNKERLLDEFIELFNQNSVVDLINYIVTKMLNKLVPSHLLFIIQEEYSMEKAEVLCFRNLKRVDDTIAIPTLKPYRLFFSLYPHLIMWQDFNKKFVKKCTHKDSIDVFLPLEPEIIVPLMGLGGLYGFIVFGKKVIDEPYSREEIEYIERIMKCSSVCLQNNIHYKRAIIDSKTNLYTYNFFMKRLSEELSRVTRYSMQLSLLMIDIDHFKVINDTYGHLAGDKILFEVGKIIEYNIRKSDIAARFGGEEFIVMLIECPEQYAYSIAERIRLIIQAMEIEYLGQQMNITVSCGVSNVSKETIKEVEELVRQADRAMYISKEKGRNRTTFYSLHMDR
jgi:diguanylate cyclase (GGDEF)-like protein